MEDLFALYQKLHSLTEEQKTSIEERDYDRLLKILDLKKEVMKKIDGIDQKGYIKNQNDPEETREILLNLMKKIKKMEDENITLLKGNFAGLKKNIRKLKNGKKRRVNYKRVQKEEARFINKKI